MRLTDEARRAGPRCRDQRGLVEPDRRETRLRTDDDTSREAQSGMSAYESLSWSAFCEDSGDRRPINRVESMSCENDDHNASTAPDPSTTMAPCHAETSNM